MPENPPESKSELYRYWRLFELVLASVYIFTIGTAISILRNPEWHGHIIRLLKRAWDIFVAQDVGSTSRGFLNGSLDTVFSIFAVAIMIGYLHGFTEFKKHLGETAIVALLVIPTVTALVYGTQFAWEVAKTTYDDHDSSVSQNRNLKQDRDSWKALATNNALIVCNPPREPKLALLVDAKEVNNRTVEIPTNNPAVIPLQMVVKNVGLADATNVTMRLYLKAGFEPPQYFDIGWQKVGSDEPDYPDEYYSTASYPPVSRTIQAGEPLSWSPLLLQPQLGVAIGDSGIPVRVKLFYGASKPAVLNFHVKARIVTNEKK